eukprot:2708767-Rhodomonas_salina.1
MARDIRVILVKVLSATRRFCTGAAGCPVLTSAMVLRQLADRTHNIRTLKHVPPHKQKDVAKETLDLYAPLAHRLVNSAMGLRVCYGMSGTDCYGVPCTRESSGSRRSLRTRRFGSCIRRYTNS